LDFRPNRPAVFSLCLALHLFLFEILKKETFFTFKRIRFFVSLLSSVERKFHLFDRDFIHFPVPERKKISGLDYSNNSLYDQLFDLVDFAKCGFGFAHFLIL